MRVDLVRVNLERLNLSKYIGKVIVWIDAITFYIASAIICGAPSFASGVIVEPFGSTTVGSEIHYQCQTPEQRTMLLCGEDGTWNPDSQSLCTGKELSSCLLIFHIHLSLLPIF